MRSLLAALAPILLLSACITTDFGSGDAVQSTLHERFAVTRGAFVSVENVSGPVVVIPWSRPLIDIVARKHSDDVGAVRNTEVEITRDGTPASDVEIHTRYPHEGFVLWGNNGASVDYTLHVPRSVVLHVENVSGAVRVAGLNGEVTIDNVSGDVAATNIGGNVRINTVSGTIDASVARMRPSTDIDVAAVSGSISLAVPPKSGAIVSAQSVSGDFDSTFPIVAHRQAVGFDANGRIGDGSGSIRMRTISGSITLSKT